ncbi:hypothetical protein JB92DRAFT_3114232 [Gautieria morchelliformis]|nr:hypothetical protein JB92DRAFT_3114232 [Gautieria morchelliformis]
MDGIKEALDIEPSTSTPRPAAQKKGATTIFLKKLAPENWEIASWNDSLAIIHLDKCECCESYATHLVGSSNSGKTRMLDNDIAYAIEDAWPWITKGARRMAVEDAQAEIEHLKRDLISERARRTCPTRPRPKAQPVAGPSSRPMAPLPSHKKGATLAPGATPLSTGPALANQITEPSMAPVADTRAASRTVTVTTLSTAMAPFESYDADILAGWLSNIKYLPPPVMENRLADELERIKDAYLAESSAHGVNDPRLQQALATVQAQYIGPHVVLPPPGSGVVQCYPGEGEPLRHGDPPISVTDHLPQPLGRSVPQVAKWYHVCPISEQRFLDLLALARDTPVDQRTPEMNMAFRRLHEEDPHKPCPNYINILGGTPDNIVTVLNGWRSNAEGVPPAIRDDVDVVKSRSIICLIHKNTISAAHTSHTRSHQSPDPHQHEPAPSVLFLPTKAHTLHHFEGVPVSTSEQLNKELLASHPPDPQPDPAVEAAFIQEMGLDPSLETGPYQPRAGPGPSTSTHAEAMHVDPRPLLASYEDIPMDDAPSPEDKDLDDDIYGDQSSL